MIKNHRTNYKNTKTVYCLEQKQFISSETIETPINNHAESCSLFCLECGRKKKTNFLFIKKKLKKFVRYHY